MSIPTTFTLGAAADPVAASCVDAVTSTISGLFDRVDEWRTAILELESSHPAPSKATVDAVIADLVVAPLSAPDATMIGAGFVARPGFVVDSHWHLSWWLGESNSFGVDRRSGSGTTRRLEADTNPASESFRDYTTLEWWRVPEQTGRRHITGPYVDYLCTDDYTLTLTTPVRAHGRLLGVVGVDIYVKHMESMLMPHLTAVGSPATVVNASGRVVVSTDPHRAAGSILRIEGLSEVLHARFGPNAAEPNPDFTALPGGGTVHDCPATTLSLVVGP